MIGERLGAAGLALFCMSASAQAPVAGPPFVVRSELSESRPWERAQVLYTVRVYLPAGAPRNDRIRSLDEPALASGEALIQRLGRDREYNTRAKDAESLLLERRYAIFPQSPGELQLAPASLQWIGGEFGFRARRFVAGAAPPLIEARAVPSPPAGRWLAAENVRIWDEFERAPDELTAGEPLIRLLGVRVAGQPARQIPRLIAGDGPNFRHFVERAEFEDQVTAKGLVGVRRQRAALLALRGGDVVLPPIRINWWNTARERWEVAELPQRLLHARGPPVRATVAPELLAAENPPARDWLAALFAGAWLLTVAAWWISRRYAGSRRRNSEIAARIEHDYAAAKSARPALPLKALAAACRSSDPQAAHNALLAWARARWPQRPPRNLQQLAQRCEPPLSNHCRRLSAALYAPGPPDWDPAALLLAVRKAPPPRAARQAPARALPPLWPRRAGDAG